MKKYLGSLVFAGLMLIAFNGFSQENVNGKDGSKIGEIDKDGDVYTIWKGNHEEMLGEVDKSDNVYTVWKGSHEEMLGEADKDGDSYTVWEGAHTDFLGNADSIRKVIIMFFFKDAGE